MDRARKFSLLVRHSMSMRKGSPGSKKWAFRTSLPGKALRFAGSPAGKVILAVFLISGVAAVLTFGHFYWEYSKLIDAKLSHGPFNRTSRILAAPSPLYVGDEITPDEVLSRLRNAGYSDSNHNQVGHFIVKDGAIEVYPGALSYFAQEPAVLYFEKNHVTRIVSLNDSTPQTVYELEPELITNLFDKDRSKRRLYRYDEFPQVLVNAVVAIEDHRFFDHSGIDIIRTTKAAWDGLIAWRRPRGTSTLTQQLSLQFFLSREDTFWLKLTRKFAELMIAFQLENRLSKEQIFQYYANQVPLGRHGSFNVMGMGEAARAYFDKDVRELTLPEAATLAAMIQRPSYLNPYRHPERARERRDIVLLAMLREGFIKKSEYDNAVHTELALAHGNMETSSAPYFVDLVNQRLQERFSEQDLITQDYWVYTTLDMDLQRAAVDAVRKGMAEVDEKIAKQRRFRGQTPPQVQAALVALDPHTGAIKAIIGGRDYGESQLNRVLAKRQPGSVFKPFVYATAIATALEQDQETAGPREILTPISLVDDVPTTFWYDDKPYEPSNFGNQIHGLVTLRYALIHSINIATVKVAEMVGYDRVADLARAAGIGDNIEPTPSLALGAYETTPLDVAGAYTVFANGGKRLKPYFISQVRDSPGRALYRQRPEETQVLDPRVAYVITHMLQDVINEGTAARVRWKYGWKEPSVAGKTGTDDDGWFAGFTNNLICVVWVGFDDNTDIKLEGADSALPIWTEFMMHAHDLRQYRNPEPFEPAEGTVTVDVDPETGELCTAACPQRAAEVFIAGSQPTRYARPGGQDVLLATNVAGWDPVTPASETGQQGEAAGQNGSARTGEGLVGKPTIISVPEANQGKNGASAQTKEKKKGFFSRILDVFK
jgi:penicillin-binding protein 1B